jgi:hypothetical protein
VVLNQNTFKNLLLELHLGPRLLVLQLLNAYSLQVAVVAVVRVHPMAPSVVEAVAVVRL